MNKKVIAGAAIATAGVAAVVATGGVAAVVEAGAVAGRVALPVVKKQLGKFVGTEGAAGF